MKQLQSQKGFTLVELAIVMTIIGLLIGGILKGQELMENARVTATVSQVKSFEAAVTTFRDSFNAVPGDMGNADQRIRNCTATCNSVAAEANNSVVGALPYDFTAAALPAAGMAAAPATAGEETQLFWMHLLLADLISGITDDAIVNAPTAPAFAQTHPAARIGGGYIVGQGDGTIPVALNSAGVAPSGLFVVLAGSPNSALNATGVISGGQPMTPARAAQIDRKMDDGRSGGGYVTGYGTEESVAGAADGCLQVGGLDYAETADLKDCGLIFRIQG